MRDLLRACRARRRAPRPTPGVPIYAGTDAGGGIAHGRIADEVEALRPPGWPDRRARRGVLGRPGVARPARRWSTARRPTSSSTAATRGPTCRCSTNPRWSCCAAASSRADHSRPPPGTVVIVRSAGVSAVGPRARPRRAARTARLWWVVVVAVLGVVAAVAATRSRRPVPSRVLSPPPRPGSTPRSRPTPRRRPGHPDLGAGAGPVRRARPAGRRARVVDGGHRPRAAPARRRPAAPRPRLGRGHRPADGGDARRGPARDARAPARPPCRVRAWSALPAPPATPEPPPRPAHRWGLGAYLIAELVFLGVSGLMRLADRRIDPTPAWAGWSPRIAVPTVAAARRPYC